MWLALVVWAVVGQAGAAPAVEVVTLENGMRWVLLPRADGGLVSGLVSVRAGGVHERVGATGVAHLLEHLAFSGTPLVGSRRGWRLEAPVQERALGLTHELAKQLRAGTGGSAEAAWLETQLVPVDEEWRARGDSTAFKRMLAVQGVEANAWTSKDTTSFWGEFPGEQLHFWLAAEAQRFAAPVFREFRTERDVVIQELRDRSSVLSKGLEVMWALAFEGSGYAWAVGGLERDLRAMSPRSLDVFYERLYAPENAVGCLVGDFDPAQARAWLADTFAQIPRRPVDLPARVAFTSPRVTRVSGAESWVLVGFERPPVFDPGSPPSEVVEELLRGEDGALHQLIKNSGGLINAAHVTTGPGVHERHLLVIALQLGRTRDAAGARAQLFQHLAAWVPTDDELVRARVSLERQRLLDLRTRRGLADELATRVLLTHDWQQVFVPRHKDVALDAVLEVTRGFTAEKAWVVEVMAP
ncbi:MAG: pitrilysin family protein [Archangium sp.]|nr:pitrilysin family protein [Archangium sp.]